MSSILPVMHTEVMALPPTTVNRPSPTLSVGSPAGFTTEEAVFMESLPRRKMDPGTSMSTIMVSGSSRYELTTDDSSNTASLLISTNSHESYKADPTTYSYGYPNSSHTVHTSEASYVVLAPTLPIPKPTPIRVTSPSPLVAIPRSNAPLSS